jgi:hypothetical protein
MRSMHSIVAPHANGGKSGKGVWGLEIGDWRLEFGDRRNLSFEYRIPNLES